MNVLDALLRLLGVRRRIPICRRCGYLERDHYLDEAEWRDAGAPNVCDMFLPGWRKR